MYKSNDINGIIEQTDVQKFFVGQNVFITGATGFLGKILLEKILRSCPEVNKVYILVRPKKDKDVKDRLKDIFSKEIFNVLKEENPYYHEKVIAIAGDCEQPDIGLSQHDKELFLQEITCIFHVAATVKFNEPLKKAMNINVRSVIDLVKMAQQMPQLTSFVHVSTAYSNCNQREIDEKFYSLPIDKNQLFKMIEILDDGLLETLTPTVLRDWPNTYVFTKAVAENYLQDVKNLPVAMVRPGIVFPTLNEPISGWTDSIYGPVGIVIGVATGLVRCVLAGKKCCTELVPADFVMNSVIAAAYDIGHENSEKDRSLPPIYNYVSSTQNPITWGDLRELLYELRWVCPTSNCLWYPFLFLTTNKLLFTIYNIFLHRLPGYFVDLILIIIGKKPILTKGYTKINTFQESLEYFSTRQWKFSTKNTQQLFEKLSEDDRKIFNFDIRSYKWDNAMEKMVKGGRRYVLKESLDTLPTAKRKIAFFYICNNLLIIFILYSFYKLLYSLVF